MKFYTINIYVDVETGETMSEKRAKADYYIIKKQKHAKQQDRTKSIVTITYTNECRRRPEQRKLF